MQVPPDLVLEFVELLQKIEGHLAPIADALALDENQANDLVAAIATDADPCVHPEKARVDLGGGDWECAMFRGGCGERHVAEEQQEA